MFINIWVDVPTDLRWRRSLDDILIKVSIWGQQPPPTCFATLCSHFLLQKNYLKFHDLYWGWKIHNIIVKFWGQNWHSHKKPSIVYFPWFFGKICLESEYGKICPNQVNHVIDLPPTWSPNLNIQIFVQQTNTKDTAGRLLTSPQLRTKDNLGVWTFIGKTRAGEKIKV